MVCSLFSITYNLRGAPFLPKNGPYPLQGQQLLPKVSFPHGRAGENTNEDDT